MTIPFTIHEMETANIVLRWMIMEDRKDLADFPNNKLITKNLDAEYSVQSRLIGFLEDMKMVRAK